MTIISIKEADAKLGQALRVKLEKVRHVPVVASPEHIQGVPSGTALPPPMSSSSTCLGLSVEQHDLPPLFLFLVWPVCRVR